MPAPQNRPLKCGPILPSSIVPDVPYVLPVRSHLDYHGHVPGNCKPGKFSPPGCDPHGWQTLLLPFVEQSELFRTIDLRKPWDHPANARPMRTRLQVYLHPAVAEEQPESGYALSHYAGNVRVLAGKPRRVPQDVPDGTSNTILAGEAAGNYRPWGDPANWRDPGVGLHRTAAGFGGPSPGGTAFVFLDGSVRFIRNDVSPAVLKALSTPDGGEPIPDY